MSGDHRRTKRMSRSCTSDITSSAVSGLAVVVMRGATLLEARADGAYPGSMRASVWILSGLAVVAVGCSSVMARAGLPPVPCGPAAARTLALTRVARAYTLRGEVYGCARGGHSYDRG